MSRFQAEPHPTLYPFVHQYWGVARDLSASGGFTVTPDRFMELVFFVGEPPRIKETDGWRRLPACTLIPLLDTPLRVVAEGVVRCAAVRMHAWSAGILFPEANASAQNWSDATAGFANNLPVISDAWRQGGWEKVPPLLDRAMLGALSGARPGVATATLTAARSFASPPDQTAPEKTETVAVRQGCSRRQIERQVRALTHRSPKQLSSLARFQLVRDALWADPKVQLAALAFEAGYSDQAHLTRHFRRYAGQTPGEFLRDCARLKAALRHQGGKDVAFLQDEGDEG